MTAVRDIWKKLPLEAKAIVAWVVTTGILAGAAVGLPSGMFPWLIGASSVATVGVYVVYKGVRLREKRQDQKLQQEIPAAAIPSRRDLAEKEKEYRQKWQDGIAKLKKANLSLYDLPWYAVLGEPGGGKTMTLLNSGMDFPMGKEELPGFGGTRNYNWWFTNTAVILDTAGRLVFEQEGTTDRQEWEAFLKLLGRRRRCPLNGVVVALPADKLMSDSTEQRYQNAAILRDRLRQIQTALQLRFPVFLLITKSDRVAGFTEFFNELDSVHRNQIFGWSRPGDFDAPFDPHEFRSHFDELYHHLGSLRLRLLARATGEAERGWIYTYPESFLALRDRVQDYVDVIFSKNIFAEPLFFRGLYLTSAMQEGRPFLEVLGQGLSDEKLDNLEGLFPQSRAFFIHDFYVRKVAREQGMVFRSQKHIRRSRWLRQLSMFVGGPILVAAMVLTFLGYRSYRRTVDEPLQQIERAVALIRQLTERPAEEADVRLTQTALTDLDLAVERVEHLDGLAAIMFGGIGTDAKNSVRTIQRELIGYGIWRPEVARAEQVLTRPMDSAAPPGMEDFAASLSAYIRWHFGDESGSEQEFRRILSGPDASSSEIMTALKQFATAAPSGFGGRPSGGLSDSKDHREKVILAALNNAQSFWLSTADPDRPSEYNWWAELFALCERADQNYQQMLQLADRFERCRSRDDFLSISREGLNLYPSAQLRDKGQDRSGADAPVNTRLYQAIRSHLDRAPRSQGRILLPRELVDRHLAAAADFWKMFLDALPENSASPNSLAESIRKQIKDYQEALKNELTNRLADYDRRLSSLGRLLEAHPPQAPERYELVSAAAELEDVLDRRVGAVLQTTPTTLEPSLEAWNIWIANIIAQSNPDTAFDFGEDRNTAALKKLILAIHHARQRYEIQMLSDGIRESLNPMPDQGLARFMEGQDDDDRAKTLRLTGLKNCHAATFVLSTAKSMRTLRTSLADAVRRDLIPDAGELNTLLDRAMRAYLQHDLAAWSDAYVQTHLKTVEAFNFDKPQTWEDYRKWLRDRGDELNREYDECLSAVFTHVVYLFRGTTQEQDPNAEIRAELLKLVRDLDWPHDDHLEAIHVLVASDSEVPDPARIVKSWLQFKEQAADFKFSRLQDLTRGGVAFKSLTQSDDLRPLAGEWYTRQVQYVVDCGQWLLWKEILDHLSSEHLQAFALRRPFVFDGGEFQNVDLLNLNATLESLSVLKQFDDRSFPDPNRMDPPTRQRHEWLTVADQWNRFLKVPKYQIKIAYELPQPQSGQSVRSFSDYYAKVVCRVHGLYRGEGEPVEELSFDAAKASDFSQLNWKPGTGDLFVAVGQPRNPQSEVLPRLLQLPKSEYGLLELILRHGEPASSVRSDWRIPLSKDLHEIAGLQNENIPDSQRGIVLHLVFVEPADGIPAPLPWPDLAAFLGDRPTPPWRESQP